MALAKHKCTRSRSLSKEFKSKKSIATTVCELYSSRVLSCEKVLITSKHQKGAAMLGLEPHIFKG